MNRWQELTGRERVLVAGLLAFLCLAVIFQFVAMPLVSFRSDAEAGFEQAVAMLHEVEAGVRAVENLRASDGRHAPVSEESTRTTVSEEARRMGLAITRIQPGESGVLTFWLNEADPQLLFSWLVTLQKTHGISASKASIRSESGADGTVAARLEFGRGEAS